ncbi:DUF342 domain-containing protein [Sporohalobacter salinus]|uniref:DUF342 domain-containing protein n=1 Tax=Sporohalobacter salinus TaxID=1494606 RepID=UPI00195FCAFF|nr:FapA family protein [Sporohalobacter salinus]MBM7623496.1 uncharacterized protein (DUF342 family) [Sporohalobacter salinus]
MKEIKLEADNEDEAIKKAVEQLEIEDIYTTDELDLNVELLEEKSGILGFGTTKVYQVQISIPEADEEINSEEIDKSSKADEESEDKEEIESQDGKVELIVNEDGIFLNLIPPQGNGKDINLIQIEDLIDAKGIKKVDYEKISEILTEDIYNEAVKIAERRPELDQDAGVEVKFDNDKMEAYLSAQPSLGGKKATLELLESALEEAGVTFGIKKTKLKKLVDEDEGLKHEVEECLIAEGEKPTPGKPAELNFKFDIESKERKVRELENGHVDFLNLNKINNVDPGDILVTKTKPQPGSPGTKVTGEKIEPESPEDRQIPAGKNTELSPDGLTLKSEIEGQVIYQGNKVDVVPIHTVQGDVDLSTGNIDFVGTVVVKGDVIDGMKVEAKNDIQVEGSVHAAELEAGGEILIENGFIGKSKGELRAKGDIKVRFIENGKIVTNSDLIVVEAIMHSDIDAAGVIKVENKGLIVGGMVRAGKGIEVKVVGSNLGTTTELYVGVTPELRDNYNQLKNELTDQRRKLEEAIKIIKYLKEKKEEIDGQLTERQQEIMSQRTRARFQIAKEVEELKEEKESLEEELEARKKGRIKVQDTIHPGVKLMIGTEVKKISKKITNVQYYIEEGEVKKGSYS